MASVIRQCFICGSEFSLYETAHYIARNNGASGISAAWSSSEEQLYDAFDCPVCGCQNIIQPRKRVHLTEVIDGLSQKEKDEMRANLERNIKAGYFDSEVPGQMEMPGLEDEVPRALDMVDAMRFGVAGVGAPSSLSLEDAIEKARLVSEGLVSPFRETIVPKEELERAINSDLENPEATIYCSDSIRECNEGPTGSSGESDSSEDDDDDGPGVDLGEICI